MQGEQIVVGLGYTARVGKDTIADYLVREHNFHKTSFATALKEGIGRGVFGFNDDQLYGSTKEAVDEFWDARLNIYQNRNGQVSIKPGHTCEICQEWERLPVTPRLILQLAGTEAGRNVFGECLWVETVARLIQNSGHSRWVIPDVRFPNEAEAVLKWGGTAWAVEASYPGYKGISGGTTGHASETSLLTFDKWSGIISNYGTFSDLYNEVEEKIIATFRR
jgi:hypothetical protein